MPVKVKPSSPPLRITAKPAAKKAPASSRKPIKLEAVRVRLEAKKAEIMELYLNDLRSGQESNDSPTEDIVDRANNAYSRELNFSISDAERTLLLQVEEALDRIEKGTYGVMVAARGEDVEPVPLEEVAGNRKLVPLGHPWILTARRVGTSLGDR